MLVPKCLSVDILWRCSEDLLAADAELTLVICVSTHSQKGGTNSIFAFIGFPMRAVPVPLRKKSFDVPASPVCFIRGHVLCLL